ncbi:type II secretion system ATPase GspE [Thiomicrorhabdus sp. Milos-T2]|uniref:type II secretion system ATPase GspE n=1 Tax=Thiomicrorhabdus sp. Milos-T2 TaxID=90814 RepID=UPI0004948D64|nr:type II secretion system ATPase GspE [Thiomicrorhabdus sp. Milos-T2]
MNIALSFSFANKNKVLLSDTDNGLLLRFTEETPASALLELQRQYVSSHIVLQRLDKTAFDVQIQSSYSSHGTESMEAIGSIETEDLASVFAEVGEPEDLLDSEDEAPIIKLLNAILSEAIRSRASDIHIEPFENELRIRFRVDGILKTVLTPKVALANMLVSRIKVMARLDIAEKRLPQDGRISLKLGGRAVDLRVSTIPSSFGERVVLRLLDKSAGRLNLKELKLPEKVENGIQSALSKSHGIFLVTGPTGSGKTTTLYAGLAQLNNAQRNIMTVEDPIEYNIDGINQTQVNSKADMTFAKGLRAILRQDPDVVMVGEIRDSETANIAVQASLTGHLVLSTLHTNSAIGAVTRLRDMKVEPFLLSSSIVGVLAQRLVRELCDCKTPHQADAAECKVLGVKEATIYRSNGCEKCQFTGYKGRMGLYELFLMDDELRSMIYSNVPEEEIEKVVRKQSNSLSDNGYHAVLKGQTDLSEVQRVTQR